MRYSITYLNNEIRNFLINTIQADFAAEAWTAAEYACRDWGHNTIAFITCAIKNESGLMRFNNLRVQPRFTHVEFWQEKQRRTLLLSEHQQPNQSKSVVGYLNVDYR